MASTPSIIPLLRRAAPRLSRHFFAIKECAHQQSRSAQIHLASASRVQHKSIRQTAFLKAFRSQSTTAPVFGNVTNLGNVAKAALPKSKTYAGRSSFPPLTKRIVAYWLFGSAASVFGIVVFGGLTRLTESGLSITEWRPVTGSLPPFSAQDWDSEFLKYRASPEFKQINPNMDLSEFKYIYWMEWTHRLWGRIVGITFLLPTIYFIARKQVSFPMARNLVLINMGIGMQGFIGWWMVKSGLKDDLFAKGAHPRVSQYRLATHLAMAFSVYVAMVWNGIQILREQRLLLRSQPNRASQFLARLSSPALRGFRLGTAALTALVSVTVVSGALVAGLDAGLIYNEFPYMGMGLTPPKSELWNSFYSRLPAPHTDLWWRNMLENPSLVQLDHRILATTTFLAVHALFFYARFTPRVNSTLTRGAKMALSATLGLAWLQVTLGLTTLLYLVPTPLASAHQAGSMALLTAVVVLGSRVWTPPRLAKMVQQRMALVRGRQAKRVERRTFVAMAKAKGRVRTLLIGSGLNRGCFEDVWGLYRM